MNNARAGSPKDTEINASIFEDDRFATLEVVRHEVHAARFPHGTGLLIGAVIGAALWIGILVLAFKLFGH